MSDSNDFDWNSIEKLGYSRASDISPIYEYGSNILVYTNAGGIYGKRSRFDKARKKMEPGTAWRISSKARTDQMVSYKEMDDARRGQITDIFIEAIDALIDSHHEETAIDSIQFISNAIAAGKQVHILVQDDSRAISVMRAIANEIPLDMDENKAEEFHQVVDNADMVSADSVNAGNKEAPVDDTEAADEGAESLLESVAEEPDEEGKGTSADEEAVKRDDSATIGAKLASASKPTKAAPDGKSTEDTATISEEVSGEEASFADDETEDEAEKRDAIDGENKSPTTADNDDEEHFSGEVCNNADDDILSNENAILTSADEPSFVPLYPRQRPIARKYNAEKYDKRQEGKPHDEDKRPSDSNDHLRSVYMQRAYILIILVLVIIAAVAIATCFKSTTSDAPQETASMEPNLSPVVVDTKDDDTGDTSGMGSISTKQGILSVLNADSSNPYHDLITVEINIGVEFADFNGSAYTEGYVYQVGPGDVINLPKVYAKDGWYFVGWSQGGVPEEPTWDAFTTQVQMTDDVGDQKRTVIHAIYMNDEGDGYCACGAYTKGIYAGKADQYKADYERYCSEYSAVGSRGTELQE